MSDQPRGRYYEEDQADVPLAPTRPAWHFRALCRGDLGWFDRDPDECKAVCARCPVKDECEAHRVAWQEVHGVWAGHDVDAHRDLLRRERAKYHARRRDEEAADTVADTCGVAQTVERPVHSREDAGSKPAPRHQRHRHRHRPGGSLSVSAIKGVRQDMDPLERATLERDHAKAQAAERYNELRTLKVQHGRTVADLEDVKQRLGLLLDITDASPTEPKWMRPKRTAKGHRATPTLMLSDLHLDEVVRPEEVHGYNAYDRSIAEMRLEQTAHSTLAILEDYVSGLTWDGFVLVLGGDILSGDIHQELAKTNEAPWADGIVHWAPKLVELIRYLADELKVPIHVPCVVGNHDRNPTNRRSPSKLRAKDSLSWVIYGWLANALRDDERITFQVAEGADLRYDLYDTRMLLTHGDQFKGGNGIGGVTMPIARGAYKKAQQYGAMGDPFDHMVLGHFHQHIVMRQFTVNGSLKGYDEYAQTMSFLPEPPAQALWITTKERGITASYPVYPSRPKAEGWGRKERA